MIQINYRSCIVIKQLLSFKTWVGKQVKQLLKIVGTIHLLEHDILVFKRINKNEQEQQTFI